MKKSIMKNNKIMNILNKSLIILPTPINISIWWNFGSLLGICLLNQIITGLFLSFHYSPNIEFAFSSLIHMIQNVNFGWIIQLMHMNGASFFFMMMFLHIGRNIYQSSFIYMKTWNMGIIIFLMTMMTAFMGYVLPWGQMSFWGATVITNLLSALPYIGSNLVEWLWGGFSVNNATLNRFFSFHFLMPFIILMMVMLHLFFLHETGSSNPLGLNSNLSKISFHPYFLIKDILGFILKLMMLLLICLISPYIMSDPENFNKANSMITPLHIQPEWYFLFAYAILRSIPNKLGGVIGLLMSILILFILPMNFMSKYKSNKFYFTGQLNFWNLIIIFIVLTWIGGRPIELPYILIGQISTFLYFTYFIMNSYIYKMHDMLLFK